MAHRSETLVDSEVIYGRWRNRTSVAVFAVGILAWSVLFAEALRVLDMRPTESGRIVQILYVDTGLGAPVDTSFTIDGRPTLVFRFAPHESGGVIRTAPMVIARPDFTLEADLHQRGGWEWRPEFRRTARGELCRIIVMRNIDDVRASDCLSPVD